MKKIFTVKSSLKYLSEVAKISEQVLSDKDFLKEISLIKKFDGTNKTGVDVVLALSVLPEINIYSYKTFNPWSKVLGYALKNKRSIYFNTRNNPRPMPKMVNTMVHETTHIAGFSHDGNESHGNENSVPYVVGKIAEKHSKKFLEVL